MALGQSTSSNENWKQVKHTNAQKRHASESENDRNVKSKLGINPSPIINTKNRFQILSDNNANLSIDSNEETLKTPKPPPIFIPGIVEVKPLTEALNEIAPNNYFLKTIGNNQIKIQPNSVDDYRKIVKKLKDIETNFHTYQAKEQRSYRVVIRNLHHSTDQVELKKEIEEKGHKVTNIYNIKQKITKKPLPLFYIEVAQNINNKSLYDIQYLQYTKVQVEPPNPKRELPQCARCQRYGHTKTYCTRQPRCVKCGNSHTTIECTKELSSPATCALCQGNHPANYKGCIVYKEIQKRKFPAIRERYQPNRTYPTTQETPETLHNTPEVKVTYAEATKTNTANQATENNKLETMLLKLMERMDMMLTLITTLVSKMP